MKEMSVRQCVRGPQEAIILSGIEGEEEEEEDECSRSLSIDYRGGRGGRRGGRMSVFDPRKKRGGLHRKLQMPRDL